MENSGNKRVKEIKEGETMSRDILGEFSERIGSDIKGFGKSTPKKECRKEILGEEFNCECTKCQKK